MKLTMILNSWKIQSHSLCTIQSHSLLTLSEAAGVLGNIKASDVQALVIGLCLLVRD